MNAANKQREKYTKLAHAGKLNGTIAGCLRKWKSRQESKPQQRISRVMAYIARRAEPIVVPIGEYGQRRLDAVRNNDRRKAWSGAKEDIHNWIFTKGSNSDWKKKSTFQRWLMIESWAKVRCDRIEYHCDDKVMTIIAPRGYRWDSDENGLKLAGSAGDYHPTADELIVAAGDKCRGLVVKLKENAAIRKQAAKKAKQQLKMVKRAETEGARICLADSLRAGNCYVGSKSWAQRHNLDPSRHYKPSQVLALANGDASRVAIVAASAIRRHQQEMERGYCNLAEHQS